MDTLGLWDNNRELAESCRRHPFVLGIADGTLPLAAFQHYVAQDAFFLDAFARAYALCLAKSPGPNHLRTFQSLLSGTLDELDLHRAYAQGWQADLAAAPTPATRAYTDFLLHVAALEPVAHACAAMTPCMRLYAWLGQELAPDLNPESSYGAWVHTYASPEFEDLATTLEDLLPQLGGDPAVIADHYATAMRLELDFFSSAHVIGATS